jgi:hypothetical protein
MCLHATDPKSCPKSLPFSNPSRKLSSTKMKTLRYFTLTWWQQLHLMFNNHFINRGFILDMYFVFHEKFATVVNQEWIVVELMHSNSYVLSWTHLSKVSSNLHAIFLSMHIEIDILVFTKSKEIWFWVPSPSQIYTSHLHYLN